MSSGCAGCACICMHVVRCLLTTLYTCISAGMRIARCCVSRIQCRFMCMRVCVYVCVQPVCHTQKYALHMLTRSCIPVYSIYTHTQPQKHALHILTHNTIYLHMHRHAAGLSPESHVAAAGGYSAVKYQIEANQPRFQVSCVYVHVCVCMYVSRGCCWWLLGCQVPG